MKQPGHVLFVSLGAALLSGAVLLPSQSSGQSDILPAPNTLAPATVPVRVAVAPVEDPATAALAVEVLQQQAKIVENQKLIDDKLAIIAENLRIARIYVSRGGGKGAAQ
jgi:hypothetical protein